MAGCEAHVVFLEVNSDFSFGNAELFPRNRRNQRQIFRAEKGFLELRVQLQSVTVPEGKGSGEN